MFISYFDESGDDGYPVYSSELFVLTSVYLHYTKWKESYAAIHSFRQQLKTRYDFPVKLEFHTKEFITDKDPYHGKYAPEERRSIVFDFCRFVSTLDVKIIVVVIDKKRIRRPKYNVLRNALTYNIQRIENDLRRPEYDGRFMIIADEGRIKKMRETARALQRYNYITSKIDGVPYRREIERLIEDPLPKSSSESYFIQIADMVSFLVSLFVKQNLSIPKLPWGKRIRSVLSYPDAVALLDILKPRFNLRASPNPYGIVYYPK